MSSLVSRLALSGAAIFIFSVTVAPAQELQTAPADERPRIGLVLGGGGARGIAHIGVLKELERLQVPVDAIAGTSMGAIVGSLYASGKSSDELEALVQRIDWADAFVDAPRRERLSFRRKQDDAAYPIGFEVGVRDGEVQLPKGLIQGQKLQLILREELLHVSHIVDFDELPIPFRAVASDIESGEAVVMGEGDLALAARASMSAPGIFSPAQVDGRTLVDGGLVGNLPIDVAREMGVDVVIAVDVEFPLYPDDKLQSALEITEQMLTILIRKETQRQIATLAADDVLIRPSLGEYASTNFAAVMETIEPGEAATQAVAEKLRALSLPAEAYAAHRASRRAAAGLDAPLDFVRVVDSGPLSARVLQSRLRTEPGDRVDPQRLSADVERLYGLNSYEQVDYRLVDDGEGHGIEFRTQAKSWGPNYLKFGLSIEDDFEGATAFNVASRLTLTGINALGAEWRNDLQLGTEPRFVTELYQPLSFDSRFFVAPRLQLEQRNLRLFAANESVARYRFGEATVGIDLGRELGTWGEFRIGALRGVGNARVKVGDPALPNFEFDNGGFFTRFSVDTLDDAQLPTRGTRLNVEWLMSRPGVGADSEFDTIEASLDRAWTWNDTTLIAGVEYATTIQSDDTIQDYFRLGGFQRLSGLERGEISGPHAALARLVLYRRAGGDDGDFLDMPLYLGASFEAGNVWQDRSAMSLDTTELNGSLFAGVDTFFGPVFLAAGFSEHGDRSFYLFLGNPPRR